MSDRTKTLVDPASGGVDHPGLRAAVNPAYLYLPSPPVSTASTSDVAVVAVPDGTWTLRIQPSNVADKRHALTAHLVGVLIPKVLDLAVANDPQLLTAIGDVWAAAGGDRVRWLLTDCPCGCGERVPPGGGCDGLIETRRALAEHGAWTSANSLPGTIHFDARPAPVPTGAQS